MLKLIGLVVVAMLLPPLVNRAQEKFAKYKSVEVYEIRPGILMMPRYSADGQVCEIGLEKLHYSPDGIRVDSSLSREEIAEIFDELVPSVERGPQPIDPLERVLGGGISGHAMVSAEQYQNVSIYIYGAILGEPSDNGKTFSMEDGVAAVLIWKNRKCQ